MTRVPTPARLGGPSDWARALATGPHYEPPYPGAVQDELAWHLVKVLREDAHLRSEVEVEVPASADWPASGSGPAFFTLDLVVEVPVATDGGVPEVRRVAFESAGATGHRALRDHDRRLRRDATLLANGAVDTIYRLRGSDLLGHMDDVLYLASQWDADLFSERGRTNLATLASREARQVSVRPEQPSVLVPYALDAEGGSPERHLWHVANGQAPHVLVRRLDRRFESVWAPYADRPLRAVEADRAPLRKAS
ncbi:hypothetical protein [Rubrivirga sp.]|uniref:hypothetical protein n=1 Tax=Rubrivirga sp. TaxID=1885344 RepID=UPI003B52F934